ncbi:MAG: sodium:proton antiporter [Bacteroidetes bacterium QS_8_68_28]|jgi:Na+/H+ antiporter NhaC|nr:MAG: sodium:proton antiporter [Bacteroidetes bacterium QS_8_68_28]
MGVLLPPLLAIGLALWTRQIYLSLLAGLWLGTTLLAGGNPVIGLRLLAEEVVAVFGSESNARILIFCILVGGLVALVQVSGGVAGFIQWAQKRGWGRTRRRAELLAWGTGMALFVESNISSLTVGAVSRPLFDTLQIPREKLAYYCDATCAPVCMMIPFNGWGAYVLGLIATQGVAEGRTVALLAGALPYNFFALFAILFALGLAVTGWGFGPMRRAEERAQETGHVLAEGARPMVSEEVAALEPVEQAPRRARDLLVPLAVMVAMIFVGLYVTGGGDLMAGSGSTAVLWAVGGAVGAAALFYAVPRPPTRAGGGERQSVLSLTESTEWALKGGAGLLGVTVLLVLAFALGSVSRQLEMGAYLVGLVEGVGAAWWMPATIFVVNGGAAFTLGSSWTAFAIMIPIALPLAEGLGLPATLVLGATLSGGIFGDHASPLSDTSIISSMAAASDHVDHVNTQLPYSLAVGAAALAAFLVAGALA